MAGDKKNIVINFLYERIGPHTNANHTCPYNAGVYYVKFFNESVNMLSSPQLMPAGRYRLDLSVYEGFKGAPLGRIKVFGSISDHRIEVF